VTLEAQLVPAGHRYRVRTAEENERAFRRANRHSRVVGILRKSLPVLAALVLAGYFLSSRLSVTVGGVTASVTGIEVRDGNLRMVNPTLKGVDKKNGNYVVTADYADQDMKNPKMIKLHAIKADLSTSSNGWSRMTAARGLFNSESELLLMQDDIRVATSSGVTGKLTQASLEMKLQTLRSHQPVSFDLSSGTVRANALTLRSGEKTLLFRGKVRVHINQVDKKQATAAAGSPPLPHVKAPEQPSRVEPAALQVPPLPPAPAPPPAAAVPQ
jgi:lipopolysaccharide export system protein LptC